MCGSGAVGSCVQGWGVKGMNAAIKAAQSKEPLEGHDNKGSWEKKYTHPTSWQHSQRTDLLKLMFTKR